MRLKLYRGVWHAVWTDERGATRRTSLRTTDRGVAAQTLDGLNQPQKPAAVVGAIVPAYLDSLAGRPSERRARDAWKALKPHAAELAESQVTALWCERYAGKRRATGIGDGTIIKELEILRAACRWRSGKATPAAFAFPPAPVSRERYLSRAEFERLRQACRPTPHLALFAVLALTTAGRAAAILELTWDRVDLEARRIYLARAPEGGQLRLTGRKGRATVPVNDLAFAALSAARPARTCDFVIEYGGKGLASVKKAFARAARRAGLAGVTPHVLRHTAAVWMAEAGVPMPQIAQYLGHRDDRITQRVYARFSPDYLADAARALSA